MPYDPIAEFNAKYGGSSNVSSDPIAEFNAKYSGVDTSVPEASLPVSVYSQTGVKMPEQFANRPLDAHQLQTFRSARTENYRTMGQLQAVGKGEEVQKELAGEGSIWQRTGKSLSTVTGPIFDLLNIFPRAEASAALEYHRSGDGYRAFKQGAADFLDALPGIDASTFEDYFPTPLHATWADYLKEAHPDMFSDTTTGKIGASIAGFVLDVISDPFFWTGEGIVSKAFSSRGGTYAKVGMALEKATPWNALKGVSELPLIGDVGTYLRKSPLGQGLGSRFITDWNLKQLAKSNPKLSDSVKNMIFNKRSMGIEAQQGLVGVRDVVSTLSENTSDAERRLLGVFLDTPDKMKSLIKQAAAGDKEYEAKLLNNFDSFVKNYEEYGAENVKAGMLSENALRQGGYAFGTYPTTTTSRKASDELMERLGVDIKPTSESMLNSVRQMGQGNFGPAHAKTYDTIEERILAGIPTEADIALQTAKRGFESVRYRATQRFVNSVLDDPNLAFPIKDISRAEELLKVSQDSDAALKGFIEKYGADIGTSKYADAKKFLDVLDHEGKGIYRPLRKGSPLPQEGFVRLFRGEPIYGSELEKLRDREDLLTGLWFTDDLRSAKDFADMSRTGKSKVVYVDVSKKSLGTYAALGKRPLAMEGEYILPRDISNTQSLFKEEPIYIMPKPIVDELDFAKRTLEDPNSLGAFMGKLNDVQGMWKAYALMSPGFHMRNMYSNIWNNALAGIYSPRPYAEALVLQGANPEKNPVLARMASVIPLEVGKIRAGEYSGEQIIEAARKLGVIDYGNMVDDIGRATERELIGRLEQGTGAEELASRIANINPTDLVGGELTKVLAQQVVESTQGRPGFAARALRDASGDISVKGITQGSLGQTNPLVLLNRAIGNSVENNAKLAHFIDKLRGGMSAEDASLSVKKYLFDYSELTDFERNVMRFFLPFYTWSRKNIPLQLQSILENPGRYSALTGKPIDAIQSLSSDWKDIPVPDYFAELQAVRMPRMVSEALRAMNNPINKLTQDQALEGIKPDYINPNLPFQDLNRMNWRDVMSALNPALKLFAETSSDRGYSTFLDRPIESYPGEPGTFGLDKKIEYAASTLFPPFGKVERLVKRTQQGTPVEQLATELAGIKLMGLDLDAVNRSKTFKDRDTLRALKRKYIEIL